MNRALGVPAALFVLIAIPSLAASPTEKPAAREAALTINLAGNEGGETPYKFQVRADGPPPAPAVLSDESGLQTANARPVVQCGGKTRAAFSNPSTTWCLQLSNLPTGHTLTGELKSTAADNTLKLTVNTRDEFFGLPLVVLILAIAAGIAATLGKTMLSAPIRRSVLGSLLAENDRSGEISGLREFVSSRLGDGESVDALITKVHGLTKNGPGVASIARSELEAKRKQVVDSGEVPESHPLIRASDKEAAREDNSITDFYDTEGTRIGHPADELRTALVELAECLAAIDGLNKEVDRLPANVRHPAAIAVQRAQISADRMASRGDGTHVTATIAEARGAIDAALATSMVRRSSGRRRGAVETADAPLAQPDPGAAELGGDKLTATRRFAFLWTGVVVLVILGFAGVTIWHETYEPNLNFGSTGDYIGLGLAALASGAAGAIILWVGYWFPSGATAPGGE